jgi:hypothetical protein
VAVAVPVKLETTMVQAAPNQALTEHRVLVAEAEAAHIRAQVYQEVVVQEL